MNSPAGAMEPKDLFNVRSKKKKTEQTNKPKKTQTNKKKKKKRRGEKNIGVEFLCSTSTYS